MRKIIILLGISVLVCLHCNKAPFRPNNSFVAKYFSAGNRDTLTVEVMEKGEKKGGRVFSETYTIPFTASTIGPPVRRIVKYVDQFRYYGDIGLFREIGDWNSSYIIDKYTCHPNDFLWISLCFFRGKIGEGGDTALHDRYVPYLLSKDWIKGNKEAIFDLESMDIILEDKYYDATYADTLRVFNYLPQDDTAGFDKELKVYDSSFNLVSYSIFTPGRGFVKYDIDYSDYFKLKKFRKKVKNIFCMDLAR